MMSYIPATIISLLLHGLLIAALIWGAQFVPPKTIKPPPQFIKASLVSVEAVSKPKVTEPKKETPQKAQPKPPPKKVDLTKQRQEQERLKKLADEQKKKAQVAKEKAEKEAKAKQAQAERDKAAKLAAEKAAKEKAEEQLRQQAEQERQQQEKQERQRLIKERQQQALLDDLAKERSQLDAEIASERVARQAIEDEEAKQSYTAIIQQRVTDAWSRPPSARNNMVVELLIELIPTGEVVNVSVSDSSGNAAFDRSAIRAVNRVGAFPELREMPRRLFDSDFRSFKLLFSPEDLRQ